MSHIYSRSLFHIHQPEILQLTAPTRQITLLQTAARPIHHNAVMLVETLCGQRQLMSLRSIVIDTCRVTSLPRSRGDVRET